jgi:uncharacterized membrane protein YbaN (DUF454 family)
VIGGRGMDISDVGKVVGDISAVSTTVGVILKVIPAIAGLLTIVWTAMRIYEMITGRQFYKSHLANWLRGLDK